jgi:hypothetical protein
MANQHGEYGHVGVGHTVREAILSLMSRVPVNKVPIEKYRVVVNRLQGNVEMFLGEVEVTPHGIKYPGGLHACLHGIAQVQVSGLDGNEFQTAYKILNYTEEHERHCDACHSPLNS